MRGVSIPVCKTWIPQESIGHHNDTAAPFRALNDGMGWKQMCLERWSAAWHFGGRSSTPMWLASLRPYCKLYTEELTTKQWTRFPRLA